MSRGQEDSLRDGVESLPTYADLPVDARYPSRSAWGVFGDDDSLGTVNLLTPERIRAALRLARRGAVFPLNWTLELPDPPILGRGRMRHEILNVGWATDDHYDNFYPQGSTQWDALSHIAHPQFGLYNGRDIRAVSGAPGSPNGVENLARQGLAGRFVLLDIPRYRADAGIAFDPGSGERISADELDRVLSHQGVQLSIGDILLIRFGWVSWYESLAIDARIALAENPDFPASGLDRDERMAEWVWDHHLAAIAADNPGLESNPIDPSSVDGFLHYRLIPLLGVLIGEMFVLDGLADDCAGDGVYEGLFTAAPLNKLGGSGSPANALAMK
jgi:kynurenine formamidase